MKKIIIVFFIIMLVTPIFLIQSNATQGEGTSYNAKMGELINSKWSDSTSASSKATSLLTTIIVGVKIAAVTVAIVMLLAVAMKYMSSAPGDRAEIKKHAVPFVVGAFVLFGASGILTLIQEISKAFN